MLNKLKLIIELTKYYSSCNPLAELLLDTAHNDVYFAVIVLHQCQVLDINATHLLPLLLELLRVVCALQVSHRVIKSCPHSASIT